MKPVGARSATAVALPLVHLGVAQVFLLLGALGLVRVAPMLAAGMYAAAPVVAVTHLLTLGWISTSILGALYQFLPVALGQPIAWRSVAWVGGGVHVVGLLLLVAGLVRAGPGVAAAGGIALGVALGAFVANLGATLRRSTTRDLTWWALAGAATFLGITIVLGVTLASNLRWGILGTAHALAVATHLTIALAGWVLLVVIGVSERLLPMFLLSAGAHGSLGRWAAAFVGTGTGVLALGHHADVVRRWLAPALLGAGAVAFVFQARAYYARRTRRLLDPGLRLAALALGLLAVAAAAGVVSRVTSPAPRLATFAITAAILAFALYVGAFQYKIVPFLVWHRHFGPLAGRQPLPRVADLYRADIAMLAIWSLVIGVAGLLAGIGATATGLATAGAGAFAFGAAAMVAQIFTIARRRP